MHWEKMENIIFINEKVNFVWEPTKGTSYLELFSISKISLCAFDLFGK